MGGGGVQQRNRELRATVHKITVCKLLINAITIFFISFSREIH